MMGTWYGLTWRRSPRQWYRDLLLLELALVFSLEEERVMQQSRDKYFPQLENQGINPVGGSSKVPHTYTNKLRTRNQRNKGVVNPFTATCESEI